MFCHGTQTMDDSRICDCLLFHQLRRSNQSQTCIRNLRRTFETSDVCSKPQTYVQSLELRVKFLNRTYAQKILTYFYGFWNVRFKQRSPENFVTNGAPYISPVKEVTTAIHTLGLNFTMKSWAKSLALMSVIKHGPYMKRTQLLYMIWWYRLWAACPCLSWSAVAPSARS